MSAFEKAQDRARDLVEQIRSLTEDADGNPVDLDEAGTEALAGLHTDLESTNALMERYRSIQESVRTAQQTIAGATPVDMSLPRAAQRSEVSRTRDFADFAAKAAKGELARDEIDFVGRAIAVGARTPDRSRALVDQTTANLPGILPPSWLTDIINFVGQARPFVTAFDQRPLPDTGLTIQYPTVTTKPQVAVQAAQKTDVASRATVVANNSANISTWAGGEDIAVQVLERTSPEYLSLVMELYAEEMAIACDTAAITAATAAITGANEITVTVGTDVINESLVAAAKVIMGARLGMPDTLVLGLDAWEAFAGATDQDGRPLFPDMGFQNPVGSASIASSSGSARGLNWVYDPNMPATKAILGVSRAFTSFFGPLRTITADVPSKLGYDAAVYQMGAFAVRRPDALVELTIA